MKLELKKKILIGLMITTLVFGAIMIAPSFAVETPEDAFGPSTNSGDGLPDGSSMHEEYSGDPDNWANGDAPDAKGPAPNSGDGVPDGSGF